MNKDRKKLLDEISVRDANVRHLANAIEDLAWATHDDSTEGRQNYADALKNTRQALSLAADLIHKLAVVVKEHDELLTLQANRKPKTLK